MVYPVEFGAGVMLLAVGYHLHYNGPLVARLERGRGADESALTPDGGSAGRRRVVAVQAAGAAVALLGLLLMVDGLGV